MHELSIAMGIVDAAIDGAQRRGVKISAVHLRLGALSGVVKHALMFSYEIACQDTALQGTQRIVEDMPVLVFCASELLDDAVVRDSLPHYEGGGFGVATSSRGARGESTNEGCAGFRIGGVEGRALLEGQPKAAAPT
jgi:Zn finger protein HypA/HybF involved in hydrogenase expression